MKNRKVLAIVGIIAGVAALCLVGLFFFNSKEYFAGQFGRKTTISNTDVSSLTVEEAVEAMNDSRGFVVRFQKEDKPYHVDISEAVTREFSEDEVLRCKDDMSFGEYLFAEEKDFEVKPQQSVVNGEKLKKILLEQLPASTVKTQDAYLDADFELVPEVQGDEVDVDRLVTQIEKGVAQGTKLEYNLAEFYVQPTFCKESSSIEKAVADAQAYRNMKVEYQFGDDTEVITWDKMKKHLEYDAKKATLTLKTKWVRPYVQKMAKKYNTYGKTREFKTTKDGVVKIQGGIMGWWIHEDDTVKQLKNVLKKKKSKTLEPVYRNVAAQHGEDDIGDTYVEISIDRQHLWFYKDGKLKLESDVVTGKMTKDRRTTVGVHRVYGKQRDRYLGTMAVQGYRSFVHYWMPFNWDGQGLHDATWRNKFGGTIYKTGGSHGCVNLPYSFAGKLYEEVTIGMPVVVY